jgi:hypothetical protein
MHGGKLPITLSDFGPAPLLPMPPSGLIRAWQRRHRLTQADMLIDSADLRMTD